MYAFVSNLTILTFPDNSRWTDVSWGLMDEAIVGDRGRG